MNSVWGRGGLFERAVENKLRNQDADTALKSSQVGVDAMNAGTKSTEVGNNYDLGMRGVGIEQMKADTGRMDANTNVFSAETNRMQAAAPLGLTGPVGPQSISNLGLRTFSAPPATQSAATPTMFIGRTAGASRSNVFSDREPLEMKRGGLIMKPKMVQPGYMHGGKITPPKGYENGGVVGSQTPEWVAKSRAETRATPEFKQAIGELTKKGWKPNPKDPESDIDAVDKYLFATKTLPERKAKIGYKAGGKIGDVKKDTGRDTIDAKVRPGEYMLNPETVRHIGGGDYAAGVRNLNQIVREATGKEPGPTPVGKSGKAGFTDGASADDLFRREALEKMAQAKRDASAARGAVGAGGTMYVDPKGNVSSTMPPASSAARAEALGARAGQAAKAGVTAVKGALPAVKGFLGTAAAPAAATLQAGYNVYSKDDFYDDPSVPFIEKGKQGLRDLARPAGSWVGGALGTGAGVGVASIPLGIGGAIAGDRIMAGLVDDEGEAYKAYRAANPKTVAAPAAAVAAPAAAVAAPPADAPRDYDKEVADKMEESSAAAEAAKPSLRDMMLNRYAMLNDELSRLNPRDQGGATARINQMNDLQKDLTDMENTNTNAAASLLNARGASGNKAVESFRKQATAAFQTDELKDGKPTGKTMFDENAFNLFEASVIAPLAAEGEDFYALPEAERMRLLSAYQDRRRGTDAVMNELSGLRDAPSSRQLINPNQLTEREMNFSDWYDPNSSVDLGALMNSAFRGDDYDKVLEYNTGREKFSLPKTAVSRTASGLRNTDVLRLYGLDKPR